MHLNCKLTTKSTINGARIDPNRPNITAEANPIKMNANFFNQRYHCTFQPDNFVTCCSCRGRKKFGPQKIKDCKTCRYKQLPRHRYSNSDKFIFCNNSLRFYSCFGKFWEIYQPEMNDFCTCGSIRYDERTHRRQRKCPNDRRFPTQNGQTRDNQCVSRHFHQSAEKKMRNL